ARSRTPRAARAGRSSSRSGRNPASAADDASVQPLAVLLGLQRGVRGDRSLVDRAVAEVIDRGDGGAGLVVRAGPGPPRVDDPAPALGQDDVVDLERAVPEADVSPRPPDPGEHPQRPGGQGAEQEPAHATRLLRHADLPMCSPAKPTERGPPAPAPVTD